MVCESPIVHEVRAECHRIIGSRGKTTRLQASDESESASRGEKVGGLELPTRISETYFAPP